MTSNERLDDLMIHGWGVYQSPADWRFSADTVHLADFCDVRNGDRILDLGMGDGALSFLLLARDETASCVGIEYRQEAVLRARKGIRHNGLEGRADVISGDVKDYKGLLEPDAFSLAVMNPPFPGKPQDGQKHAFCRVMPPEDIYLWLRAAAWAVKNRGRVCLVYPCSALQEVLWGMKDAGLCLKRLEIVKTQGGCKVFLAEGIVSARPGGTVVSVRDELKENNSEEASEE